MIYLNYVINSCADTTYMKKNRFKYNFIKFLGIFSIISFLLYLLLWSFNDDVDLNAQEYWIADFNTLKCRLMQESLQNWILYQKKTDNYCEIHNFGKKKLALLCQKGHFVVGTSALECLEAGIAWRKSQNWQ